MMFLRWMMKDLTYVTGNYGKYVSVKKHFEDKKLEISYCDYDLEEPVVNDIEYISKEKAREAYALVGHPVIVADTGFYIEAYPNNPGYPGALVKRSGISKNVEELLKTMKQVENRNCYFKDCLTFFDGKEFKQFLGISEGTLSNEKRGIEQKAAKSNLWYVFIPKNETKTLAEMTPLEFENRSDDRVSATELFIDWYTHFYLEQN